MTDTMPERYIGTYQITDELGEGSFGEVFSAYQPFLDRKVAIKTLHSKFFEQGVSEKLFIREGQLIARLRHPNIVNIYEFGIAPDSATNQRSAFMVMEYLPGGTLQSKLSQGSLPVGDVVVLIEQIAQGLTYAHEQNIIHRDLKPANILFTANGQPVIVDFGLAKLAEDALSETVSTGSAATSSGHSTLSSSLIGTPRYIAPEQLKGEAVTGATDQYALALIAFQMLTGVIPFDSDNITELMVRRSHQPSPSILAYAPTLPPEVDAVFQRALAIDPATRYPSTLAFADALCDVLAPDYKQARIVKIIDPLQAVQIQTARRYMNGFLTAVGLFVLLVILYCSAEFIRDYGSGAFPEFMWDGLLVSSLKLPDGTRIVNGVMPGSFAEGAGYQVGDKIQDDIILDKTNPKGQYTVNGVPRSALNVDWKPKPGDVIEREVERGNNIVTLKYTLFPNIYSLFILAATIFCATISLICGFWLLQRWGPEPLIQLYVPLMFLFSVFVVARAVANLVLYLDTLTFHLVLAVSLHLILVFPEQADWVKRHPRRIWWIYLPVVVGLYYFIIRTPIVLPGLNLPIQAVNYVGYTVCILVLIVVKWLRRDLKHYPGLRWLLMGFGYGMLLSLYYVVVFYLLPADALNKIPGGTTIQALVNDIGLVVLQSAVPFLGTIGIHVLQQQMGSPLFVVRSQTADSSIRGKLEQQINA